MREKLQELLKKAILELQATEKWPSFDVPQIVVDYPKDEQFGDYATNIAMALAKIAKKNPLEIAENLKSQISNLKSDELEKIEVAAPGYLNFYLSPKCFADLVFEITDKGDGFGDGEAKKEKSMVEYSQPNTHKEFHIGHLRNVVIGSAIVNVLKKSGYPTIAANYIGDTGTHIAKCLWGLSRFHSDEDLDSIPNKAEFLGKVYSEAVQAIEENPSYDQEFRDLQKKFEEGDTELRELWEKTKQWSLNEFYDIYGMLGVRFDEYFFESEEEVSGKQMVPQLLEKGVVVKSDGAIVADLESFGLGVLVLVRKDGSALYGLKDIPLAIKKFEKFDIDSSIYVVDIRQSLYFKQLFKILELYGFHKKMAHIGYEFVTLADGESMSSRKGNVVPARKLIEEVIERVRKQYPESPDPVAIGLGAIKFFMLKYSNGSKIEFDIDEAVKLNGATGPYVQYAYARIGSIIKKAESLKSGAGSGLDLSLLTHPKEISLMRELSRFPELVEMIAQSYEVHKLPHYAIRLADKFHSFYDECRVIDETNLPLTEARLKLVSAVQIVLGEVLNLIGVSAPEKM